MTRKIYKTAMGKTIDLGALLLQNEQTRAVGNMNVNARGDRLDSANRVIEQKSRQVQRQYNRQTNVSTGSPQNSTISAKQKIQPDPIPEFDAADTFADLPDEDVLDALDAAPVAEATVEAEVPVVEAPANVPAGGLAAAIARTREVKQELEKTQRQKAQSQGVRKI